jgi:hypothetical protein
MLIYIINITTQKEVIVIEDPDECTYFKPIITLLLITTAIDTLLIVSGNLVVAIWTTLFMLSFMITLLLINKRKYFQSEHWQTIKYPYANDIKMINALNASIKSSLQTYACEININCSAETFEKIETDPTNTIIKLFERKSITSLLKYLNDLEREYRIVRKEYAYIKTKLEDLDRIKKKIPFFVRIITKNIYSHMEVNIIESIKYPKYKFSYYCNTSGHYQTCVVVLDEKLIAAIRKNLENI